MSAFSFCLRSCVIVSLLLHTTSLGISDEEQEADVTVAQEQKAPCPRAVALELLEAPLPMDAYPEDVLAAAMHGIAFGWETEHRWDGDLQEYRDLWQAWLESEDAEERDALFVQIRDEWREPVLTTQFGNHWEEIAPQIPHIRQAQRGALLPPLRRQHLRRAWFHLPPGPTQARWLSLAAGLGNFTGGDNASYKYVEHHSWWHHQSSAGRDATPLLADTTRRQETLRTLFTVAELYPMLYRQWGERMVHDLLTTQDLHDSELRAQIIALLSQRDIPHLPRLLPGSGLEALPIDTATADPLPALLFNAWIGNTGDRRDLLAYMATQEEPKRQGSQQSLTHLNSTRDHLIHAFLPSGLPILESEVDQALAQALLDPEYGTRHYRALFLALAPHLAIDGPALAAARDYADGEIAFVARLRLLDDSPQDYAHIWAESWQQMSQRQKLQHLYRWRDALQLLAAHGLLEDPRLSTMVESGLSWILAFSDEDHKHHAYRLRNIVNEDWGLLGLAPPDIVDLVERLANVFAESGYEWKRWTEYLARRLHEEVPLPVVDAVTQDRPLLAAQVALLRGDTDILEDWWRHHGDSTPPGPLLHYVRLQGWQWPSDAQLLRGDVKLPFTDAYRHRFYPPAQRPGLVVATHLMLNTDYLPTPGEIPWDEWANHGQPGQIIYALSRDQSDWHRHRGIITDFVTKYGLPLRDIRQHDQRYRDQRELALIAHTLLHQRLDRQQLPWLLQAEMAWQHGQWREVLGLAQGHEHMIPDWMWPRIAAAAWLQQDFPAWQDLLEQRMSQSNRLAVALFFQQQGALADAGEQLARMHPPALPSWQRSDLHLARWRQAMAQGDAAAAEQALTDLRSYSLQPEQQAWLAHAQGLLSALQGEDAAAIQEWFSNDAGFADTPPERLQQWMAAAEHSSWRRHCAWYWLQRTQRKESGLPSSAAAADDDDDTLAQAWQELLAGEDLLAHLAQRVHHADTTCASLRLTTHWSSSAAMEDTASPHQAMMGLSLTPAIGSGMHQVADYLTIKPNLWPHIMTRHGYRQIGQGHWLYVVNNPLAWQPGVYIYLKRINGQDHLRQARLKPIAEARQ